METNWDPTLPSSAPPPYPSSFLTESSYEPRMKPHHQGFYNYYPQDPSRPSERHPISPHHEPMPTPPADEQGHRRSQTQPSNFLPPPPPPHSTSPQTQMLPPFHSSFYPGYHAASHSQSSSAPSAMSMQYGNGPLSASAPPSQYSYRVTSPPTNLPLADVRGPPPHPYAESPRISTVANWSTSPGLRHLSPTSPTTHLGPPHIAASSGSTSSSSYPSATRTPGNLPPARKTKRRSGSTSMSAESWDDEKYGGIGELGEETEEQPWGMPQDEYKALNPKDKKQVRNRIGARRFRAKRKNYVSTLEHSLRIRDDRLASLRSQLNSHHAEINDLRSQLGIAPLPPLPGAEMDGALGLVVNHSDGWDDKDQL